MTNYQTLLDLINEQTNSNFESIEAVKDYNKEYLFNEANNEAVIDLKSNDIYHLYIDFNSSKLASICGLPQSSLSDKILKGIDGIVYNSKDINFLELSRYLRDKKIDFISVKDFRECVAESVLEYEISLTKNNYIGDNKIVNIKRMKNNKISKIDDFIFILDNFQIVSGEQAKVYFVKALNIPAGKKYRFVITESK